MSWEEMFELHARQQKRGEALTAMLRNLREAGAPPPDSVGQADASWGVAGQGVAHLCFQGHRDDRLAFHWPRGVDLPSVRTSFGTQEVNRLAALLRDVAKPRPMESIRPHVEAEFQQVVDDARAGDELVARRTIE